MSMNARARRALMAATALGCGIASPALAQKADSGGGDNDIIVTAQRVEQRLQDVPISITVLSGEKLSNNNITSAKDIATYTPGLTTNNRYGSDNTTWTIRGFTQEQRTSATVGTYFGDVVAPRGSGATQGGDGAGPGQMFDLQNVQVLKGPQGTLFGRNSTGGAVLLVPKKPTAKLEGYIEGSVGDYGMWRVQDVINIPIDDAVRIRFGMDHMSRDGYLKNAGKIGFGPFGDAGGSVKYTAYRLSTVVDLTPNLENYSIFTYQRSDSTGVQPKINQCFTTNPYTGAAIGAPTTTNPITGAVSQASGGYAACAQMQREAALGFWSVSNGVPDSASRTKQWQMIDTLTWHASDNLTIKNTMSYAQFRGTTNLDLFGWYRPLVTPGTEVNGLQVQTFNTTHTIPNGYTNAESSFVEELQFQYHSSDNKLQAQGGLYYEASNPLGESGIQSTTQTACVDIGAINCLPGQNGSSIGRLAYQTTATSFRGKAIYFQASYDLSDKLKLTGGIRYTEDTMESRFRLEAIRLYSAPVNSVLNGTPITFPQGTFFYCLNDVAFGRPGSATNPYQSLTALANGCAEHHKIKTSAPTWLIDIDYKPMDDVLLYAKWSRGYRQGGVAAFAADQLQDYKAEKVDTFEVGAKTSWRGAMPGWFNVAAFYNNFRDQQLQIGLSCNPVSLCAQTTAIVNAGKSSLKGFEVETGITPFPGLRLDASYAYLKTTIKAIDDITALVAAKGLPFNDVRPLPLGSEIPNSMPHKLTISANYTLPLPEALGKLTFGGTWIYQSKYRAVSDPFMLTAVSTTALPVVPYQYGSSYGVLPGNKLLNLNVNWERVAGLPVDAAFFVTNVTNAKVLLHANVQSASGFVSNIIGEPRMFGTRLKVRF